jgi:hypothetical protein
MEQFCQAHLARTGKRIHATRTVNDEPMCNECFRGRAVDPLEDGIRFGELPFFFADSLTGSKAQATSSDNATGRGETASRKIHSPTASVAR